MTKIYRSVEIPKFLPTALSEKAMLHVKTHLFVYVHTLSDLDEVPDGWSHMQLLRYPHFYCPLLGQYAGDLELHQFAYQVIDEAKITFKWPAKYDVFYMNSIGMSDDSVMSPETRLNDLPEQRVLELVVWCRFRKESTRLIERVATTAIPSHFRGDNADVLASQVYLTFARVPDQNSKASVSARPKTEGYDDALDVTARVNANSNGTLKKNDEARTTELQPKATHEAPKIKNKCSPFAFNPPDFTKRDSPTTHSLLTATPSHESTMFENGTMEHYSDETPKRHSNMKPYVLLTPHTLKRSRSVLSNDGIETDSDAEEVKKLVCATRGTLWKRWSQEELAKLDELASRFPVGTKDRLDLISYGLKMQGFSRTGKQISTKLKSL